MTPPRGGGYDAIVVGAGHNGLITAARLAGAGVRTLVLEARGAPGGAAATQEPFPGYRFDTCPDAAGQLHPVVRRGLGLAGEGLQLLPGEPTLAAVQPDGRRLVLPQDPGSAAEAVRAWSPRDAEQLPHFARLVGGLAAWLDEVSQLPPPRPLRSEEGRAADLLRWGWSLRRRGRQFLYEALRTLPMPLADLMEEWFQTPGLRAALGAPGLVGLAQGPLSPGTAYGLLRGLPPGAFFRPAVFAAGGIGVMGQALAAAARRRGAEVRLEAAVERILLQDGWARGVVLEDGEEIPARLVSSSADPRRTYFQLVGPQHLDPGVNRAVGAIKYRGALSRINLALDGLPRFDGLPPEALRGRMVLCPDLLELERAYDQAKYGRWSRRPYIELVLPSLSDPSLAPAGGHVLSAAVQYTPYALRQGSWETERQALLEAVVETISSYAPNLRSILLHAQVLTPQDLEQEFLLTEGQIHQGEHTLDQIFLMRPMPGWAGYRSAVPGLYLCGAGTHPGGGLSGLPGWHAARQILSDLRQGRIP